MYKQPFHSHFTVILLSFACVSVRADTWQFADSFGARQDSLAAVLIAQQADSDSADVYRALDRAGKAQFLRAFWEAHNPVLLRFYYLYHMGHRYLTVSDAFFERGDLIPYRYKTGAVMPDPVMVQESLEICQGLVTDYRDDLVAQNAFGYCLLEQRKGNEAEHVFLDVLARDKHFLAARYGRGLACLIQKKQIGRALDYFQDTVSIDSKYEAASV